MELKLHPDYRDNGWIYISYSYFDEKDKKKGNTAIIRARLSLCKLGAFVSIAIEPQFEDDSQACERGRTGLQ